MYGGYFKEIKYILGNKVTFYELALSIYRHSRCCWVGKESDERDRER